MTGKIIGAALAATLSVAGAASAQTADILALTDGNSLVSINGSDLKAGREIALAGVTGKVVGIDVRPSDGQLYAVTDAGGIYTVAPASGQARLVSNLSEKFDAGMHPVVDFNPAADRLRLIGANGVSYRVEVETGKVTVDKPLVYDMTDANTGKRPMVRAGAYTNSMAGAKATELFHLEGTAGVLVLQAPPNDGILKTRGSLGMTTPPKNAAMDVYTDAAGKNTAWLLADGKLHEVDLATGKPNAGTMVTGLNRPVIDIAVMQRR